MQTLLKDQIQRFETLEIPKPTAYFTNTTVSITVTKGAIPPCGTAPIVSEHFIYSLTSFIQSTTSVHSIFFEPSPKSSIVKPYSNHHHTKHKTSTKIRGYSSFLMLFLQSCIINRISSPMGFFGFQIQVG